MNKNQFELATEDTVVSVPGAAIPAINRDADVAQDANQRSRETVTPIEKNESEHKPLTPSEFCSVLQRLDKMGLTWTSHLPPNLVAKDANTNGVLASAEVHEIQNRYPMFPNELGYVIWYSLTGTEPLMEMVGSEEDLKAKSAIVRDYIVTPDFRDDFFFRHMLKLPYFENIDWEVIVKTSERGVQTLPGNAYALVSILLESNSQYGEKSEHFTFAINEQRLEKLRRLFGEMHEALQTARKIGDCLNQSQEKD